MEKKHGIQNALSYINWRLPKDLSDRKNKGKTILFFKSHTLLAGGLCHKELYILHLVKIMRDITKENIGHCTIDSQ